MKTVYKVMLGQVSFRNFLLVALAVVAWRAAEAQNQYTYAYTLGSTGSGPAEFQFPTSLATDENKNLYVADASNHRIQVFNASGDVSQFGKNGTAPGELRNPTAVQISPTNHIYVGSWNGVDVFTMDGKPVSRPVMGIAVSGMGIDRAGNVYVTDGFKIDVYNPDLSQHIKTIGEHGSGNGQFDNARDITFDSEGHMYVVDMVNHRVQIFTASGAYLGQFGGQGTGNGQFNYPVDMATDGSGFQYITDSGNGRVQVGRYDFNLQTWVAVRTFGSTGSGVMQFQNPYGVALDADGKIYVSDGENRVKVFSKTANEITGFADFGKTYGDADFVLHATNKAEPDHNVVFEKIDDPANTGDVTITTTSGVATAKILRAGKVKIRAIAPDDADYSTATKDITLTIAKATQQITLDALQAHTYGDAPFAIQATATSGLPVTLGSSNPDVASIAGNIVTIKAGGTVTISAQQPGNENYLAGATVNRQLTIAKAAQQITFHALEPSTYGIAPFALAATADSGLPITYTSSNTAIASIAGNIVTIKGAGTVTITAQQSGDETYLNADPVSQELIVAKAPQQIVFHALPTKVFGEAPFALQATATSGLALTFSSSDPAIASVAGNIVTLKAPGKVTITVQQGGSENYLAATSASQVLEISAITGVAYDEHNSTRVYPVPAQDVITINAAFAHDITPVTICDIQGRVVRQVLPEVIDAQTRRINVADLTPGLYLLNLNDGKNKAQRIIKN